MSTVDFSSKPLWSEWVHDEPTPAAFETVQAHLKHRGYRVHESENEDGRYRILASRESLLGARKRRTGKLMLAGGVVLTIVLLVMLAEDIGAERSIVSLPLLIAVLLGGMGLNRLRDPALRIRNLLEVHISPMADGRSHVLTKGASGPVPDSNESSPPSAEQEAAAEKALLDDMHVGESDR